MTNDASALRPSRMYRPVKRLLDIVLAVSLLVFSLPFIAALCVIIKCDSSGPVIFSQERLGRKNRRFVMYKLRTMVEYAEREGPVLAVADDGRITRVGRFLRRYHLDELPQLWNVIRGDMSIVGPRPEREYYVNQILLHVPEYRRIAEVRPGLTSWGNVRYGYASDLQGMLKRLRYDLQYIDDISPATDIKVMFYTIKILITGNGI